MTYFQTSILYYSLIIITTIIVSISQKKSLGSNKLGKLLFWLAVIPPILISGYRFGIGVDYVNYESIYYRFELSNDFMNDIQNSRFEPAWILLNYFVKYVFNDVQYIFIISSLLIWIFNFKAIYDHRDKINVGIAVLILMTTMYNPSFNIIRISLAASILMLSVKPILDKKAGKFILLVLLASSFHYTSLVFLPTYWIVNSKTGNRSLIKKIISIVGAIGFIIFARPILSFITNFDIFTYYSNYEIEYDEFGFGVFFLKVPILIIILLNLRKLKQSENLLYKISVLYFISFIFNYLGYLAEYANRIAIYFEMMQIFIVASIIYVQKNKYEKLLYSFLVILYYLAWFTYNIIIFNSHKTIPYMWIQ